MKSKEEIIQLAEKQYPIEVGGSMWMPNTNDIKKANEQEGYIKGYTQCQEDMLILLRSEIKRAYQYGQTNAQMIEAGLERDEIEEYVNHRMLSLNKQD
jgi:hypothetical protein